MYEYHLLIAIDTMLDLDMADLAVTTAHMMANLYFDRTHHRQICSAFPSAGIAAHSSRSTFP